MMQSAIDGLCSMISAFF